jgi:hypothetical protein
MTDAMEINFSEITEDRVRNISGHERGVKARTRFMLDKLDRESDMIDVVIPQDIEAIATSFFQGMFSKSVQRFGSKEGFLSHYRFVAAPLVMEQILRGIERSLTARQGAAFEN